MQNQAILIIKAENVFKLCNMVTVQFIFFILISSIMIQNLMFSKETLDKVKLAKQFIENKYQSIINQQKKDQQNWNKIYSLVDPGQDDLEQITLNIVTRLNINKRLQRQKDKLENYKLHNVIGRGAFGEVRLARNIATNEVVAIKRLQKKYLLQKRQVYNAYLQRNFMIKNQSNFVVQMRSTFQDEDFLYIVMQYIQGGDLLHLLIEKDILSEEWTRFYIAQLILAVEEIHKMNYIHRDIKPDNILIDRTGHIKISDFGLSKYLQIDGYNKKKGAKLTKLEKLKKLTHLKNKERVFSKVGTPDYISPEVLTDKVYSHSVDIWGIGVIMFECLYGYPPFTDQDSKQVCHKVANWVDYLEFPEDIEVSTAAKMLMLGLMNHASKRLTIKQIKKHPFFEQINWQTLHKQRAPYVPKIKTDIDTTNFDQFQVINPWTDIEKQLTIKVKVRPQSKQKALSQKAAKITQANISNEDQQSYENMLQDQGQDNSKRKNVSYHSVEPKFRFAGFDYRRLETDPLEMVAKDLMRKSYSHKSLKKLTANQTKASSNKNLRTEQCSSKLIKFEKSSRPSIKNKLLKIKKPSEKTKGSEQQLNTISNISITMGRMSTSKDLLRTIRDENQSQNKCPNRTVNSITHQQGNSCKKKNLSKTKADKIKQIYSSMVRNIKSKKNCDQNDAHCRTYA